MPVLFSKQCILSTIWYGALVEFRPSSSPGASCNRVTPGFRLGSPLPPKKLSPAPAKRSSELPSHSEKGPHIASLTDIEPLR